MIIKYNRTINGRRYHYEEGIDIIKGLDKQKFCCSKMEGEFKEHIDLESKVKTDEKPNVLINVNEPWTEGEGKDIKIKFCPFCG